MSEKWETPPSSFKDGFTVDDEDAEDFAGRLLHQAALWDNAELLEDLLNGEQLAYINSLDTSGRTALHAAVVNDSPECTRILLQAGANPNIACGAKEENKTPLHVAAQHGNLDAIRLLVEWQADLLAKNSHGLTAMDLAEQANHTECMEILKQAADEREKRRLELHQALHDACTKGDVLRAKALLKELDKDAELVINSAPNGSNTLLFKACEDGQKEIVRLLLDQGADCRIHPVTKYSPLYIACYYGRKEIVELLLKKFPQLIQVTTVERWLPIHAAAINGHVFVLDLLLRFPYPSHIMLTFQDKTGIWEYQMPFDINARDVTGHTVLYLACYVGNQKLVDVLLKYRVKAWKINSENQEDDMHEENGEVKCDFADENGGNISPTKKRISNGIQALMSKLNLNKMPEQVTLRTNETLLNPVDLDAYCNNGSETALHAAVRAKHHAITAALLQNGANPNLKIRHSEEEDDENGGSSTALVEACRSRDTAMIDLLLKHNARDDECRALTVAVKSQDESIISRLLTLNAHPDPEYKINRKAFDTIPATQFKALGFAGVNSVTPSSMFPSTPVMINWHGQHCLTHIQEQWLIDASIAHNAKLKLNPKNQSITLHAITRLDISNNTLLQLPDCIFQLQSLKYLNAAQNKIERLPSGVQNSPQTPKLKSSRHPSDGEPQYQCPVLEEIHLQDNRLDSVPPALFQLPSLAILDLSNNKLQSLPFKMWTAPKLRELNLSFNLLKDLPLKATYTFRPTFLDSKLSTRTSSDDQLSASSDASPRHGFCHSDTNSDSDTNIPENLLKLSQSDDTTIDCHINLYPNSSPCINLQPRDLIHHNLWSHTVEVSESYLDSDDESRDHQSQLTTLNLAHNAFESIPNGLCCLAISLARLNLSYNRLTDMGPVNMYPAGLKQLDLSHNLIKTWPSLRRWDSDFSIDTQVITCYGLSDLPNSKLYPKSPIAPVRKLTRSTRGSCSSLTSLTASFCIHRRHTRLENLRTLILSDNHLDRLVLCVEDENGSVTSDDDESQESVDIVGSCQKDNIKSVSPTPSTFKSRILFPNLSMLDISNNCLREIPPNISELSNLSVLNVSGNTDICQLPPEMGLLSKLWNLNTRGCSLYEPLKTMIESKKYKTMDVVGYLKSILEDAKPYARMKLMIVGVQGIGKTSLLDQLRQEGYGSYKKKPVEHWAKRMGNKNINLKTAKGINISTVGVDIGDWTFEKKIRGQSSHGPVTFRTWDFGGQREYYSTHQYFLSKRSLYLVVWKITDGKKGVDEILQWLVNIQARAPNSPVLIIGTHYDLVKEKFPPSFSEDLQQLIRDRFINVVDADKCGLPRVLDTIEVSCKTRHNVKLLCNLIYDTVFELRSPGSKERLLEQKIPATYLALEDVIGYLSVERRFQGKDPVLQSEQYKMLVMHEMQERFHTAFRDMAELNQATTFLHENGVLLHYEDATLKDLYFLDPQWLCDMLAHVVTIREINPFARNGIMKLDDLKHIFKTSHCAPTDAKSYIVNLLNKFEVALTWDNRTLLIPSLLPTEDLLRLGIPGCDVRIPVRSRGWAMRCKAFQSSKASTVVGSPQRSEENHNSVPTSSGDDCEILHRSNPHYSIRRLLLMSYFPSGFWSRLMTRMLADDSIVEIIRSYLVLPREVQQDPGLIGLLQRHRAEWLCWQSGMELRYANTTLFHMKEVLPHLNNHPLDYRQMHFFLLQEGLWTDVDLSGTAILEIYLPNQTVVLQRKLNLAQESGNTTSDAEEADENTTNNSEVESSYYQRIILDPNPECVAKLLALAIDHIDTLLEDWYPMLGTRFVHTSEGKFLVTRLVPCTHCLISQMKYDVNGTTCHGAGRSYGNGSNGEDSWQMVEVSGSSGEPCVVKDVSLGRHNPEQNRGSESPTYMRQNRGSRGSATSHDSDSGVGPDSTSSSRKPSAEGHTDAEVMLGQDQNNPDPPFNGNLDDTVYTFMVEDCILTAYEDREITCPVHGDLPLAQIAPDAVFHDLGERYLIRPESIKRGKMLGRGAFGFVFKATVKVRASNSYIDVAMKMLQPVDPGFGARQSAAVAYKAAQSKWQRDPIQYACKAYCTARQELNILLALRHPNIVPLVGVCTRPLALILELAPQGALDSVLKNYRRSGARLNLFVLQKIILQIAKALEYLHQQHIIYRDLKSENVLVWALPPPFFDSIDPYVDVKLADYGISRSTLPTGTKGFGGTEGFMAPEIMRYNGEEEYTEKVDCFSFGMFMYELITLHLPFEGHESVKDHVLDGGRPSLTQRETIYPTYMLDLMVLCWSQQPKDRPSASQIVSIASAPEFVHLLNVVSLEEQITVICAAAAEIYEEFGISEWALSTPQVDIWLSRLGRQLDILTCNQHGWQESKSLCVENVTVTQICVVGDKVWLGDSKGVVHIYSTCQHSELHSFALEPDAVSPCAIRSMCYIREYQRVAVALSNGRLWLYAANFVPCPDGSLPDDFEGHVMSELGTNGNPIHCMAALYLPDQKCCELWCGQTQGTISIFKQKETVIISQDVINHYEPVLDNIDVLQIVAGRNDDASVWSYIYPGCVVYHWDAVNRTILNKLDCSKLVPCSESLKSISIEEHLSPGRCQVTAMAVLGNELYIGTTWGCIVVAESASMRPATVFRPFEEEVKAILPAFHEDTSLMSSDSTQTEAVTPTGSIKNDTVPIVIAIGKGYRSLIGRFTNLPSIPSALSDSLARKSMYALLWKAENWSSS